MSWFLSSTKVASSSGWRAVGRRWCSCFRAKLSRFFTMLDALAARSLLIQGPLKLGGPLRWREGLPGPADQTRRRHVYQISEGTVGTADPSAAVDDAEGRPDRVHHVLPGAPSLVLQVDQPGAL